MEKTEKKRIFYFDFLRAIAITSVIICHSLALNPFAPLGGGRLNLFPLDTLGYIGVPLFFMLSGALLLNREYDLQTFFKKRFSRIVYPYIFWFCIIAILNYFVFNITLKKIIFIGMGIDSFTWYIWELIGLYLFIPIINTFIKEYSEKGIHYYLFFWVITISLNTIGKYPFHNLDLSYFSGYLGFLLLGYYLSNKQFKLNEKWIMIISFIIFLVSFIIHSELRIICIETLTSSGYLNIFPLIETGSLFIFIKYLSEYYNSSISPIKSKNFINLKNYICKLIFSISYCSYAMYFTHTIAINLVNTFTDINISFLALVIEFFLAWIIALISSKIPIVKNFAGVK